MLVLALVAVSTAAVPVPLRDAPQYVPLFAPRVHRDAYSTYVSPLPLGDLLRELSRDPLTVPAPGSWQARDVGPFDAFGETGTYDRFRIARLYGGRQLQVARGPRGPAGTVSEMWTLVSPYPDPTLSRLEPGTLVIVLRITRQ